MFRCSSQTSAYTFYGAFQCTLVCLGFLEEHQLLTRMVANPETGGARLLSYPELFNVVMYYNSRTFSLGVFCLLISIVLFCFAMYQSYLVLCNKTTNETFKIEDASYHLKRLRHTYAEYEKKLCAMEGEGKREETCGEAVDGDDGGGSGVSGVEEVSREGLETLGLRIKDMEDILGRNIYDKGWRGNCWEILRPPSDD